MKNNIKQIVTCLKCSSQNIIPIKRIFHGIKGIYARSFFRYEILCSDCDFLYEVPVESKLWLLMKKVHKRKIYHEINSRKPAENITEDVPV